MCQEGKLTKKEFDKFLVPTGDPDSLERFRRATLLNEKVAKAEKRMRDVYEKVARGRAKYGARRNVINRNYTDITGVADSTTGLLLQIVTALDRYLIKSRQNSIARLQSGSGFSEELKQKLINGYKKEIKMIKDGTFNKEIPAGAIAWGDTLVIGISDDNTRILRSEELREIGAIVAAYADVVITGSQKAYIAVHARLERFLIVDQRHDSRNKLSDLRSSEGRTSFNDQMAGRDEQDKLYEKATGRHEKAIAAYDRQLQELDTLIQRLDKNTISALEAEARFGFISDRFPIARATEIQEAGLIFNISSKGWEAFERLFRCISELNIDAEKKAIERGDFKKALECHAEIAKKIDSATQAIIRGLDALSTDQSSGNMEELLKPKSLPKTAAGWLSYLMGGFIEHVAEKVIVDPGFNAWAKDNRKSLTEQNKKHKEIVNRALDAISDAKTNEEIIAACDRMETEFMDFVKKTYEEEYYRDFIERVDGKEKFKLNEYMQSFQGRVGKFKLKSGLITSAIGIVGSCIAGGAFTAALRALKAAHTFVGIVKLGSKIMRLGNKLLKSQHMLVRALGHVVHLAGRQVANIGLKMGSWAGQGRRAMTWGQNYKAMAKSGWGFASLNVGLYAIKTPLVNKWYGRHAGYGMSWGGFAQSTISGFGRGMWLGPLMNIFGRIATNKVEQFVATKSVRGWLAKSFQGRGWLVRTSLSARAPMLMRLGAKGLGLFKRAAVYMKSKLVGGGFVLNAGVKGFLKSVAAKATLFAIHTVETGLIRLPIAITAGEILTRISMHVTNFLGVSNWDMNSKEAKSFIEEVGAAVGLFILLPQEDMIRTQAKALGVKLHEIVNIKGDNFTITTADGKQLRQLREKAYNNIKARNQSRLNAAKHKYKGRALERAVENIKHQARAEKQAAAEATGFFVNLLNISETGKFLPAPGAEKPAEKQPRSMAQRVTSNLRTIAKAVARGKERSPKIQRIIERTCIMMGISPAGRAIFIAGITKSISQAKASGSGQAGVRSAIETAVFEGMVEYAISIHGTIRSATLGKGIEARVALFARELGAAGRILNNLNPDLIAGGGRGRLAGARNIIAVAYRSLMTFALNNAAQMAGTPSARMDMFRSIIENAPESSIKSIRSPFMNCMRKLNEIAKSSLKAKDANIETLNSASRAMQVILLSIKNNIKALGAESAKSLKSIAKDALLNTKTNQATLNALNISAVDAKTLTFIARIIASNSSCAKLGSGIVRASRFRSSPLVKNISRLIGEGLLKLHEGISIRAMISSANNIGKFGDILAATTAAFNNIKAFLRGKLRAGGATIKLKLLRAQVAESMTKLTITSIKAMTVDGKEITTLNESMKKIIAGNAGNLAKISEFFARASQVANEAARFTGKAKLKAKAARMSLKGVISIREYMSNNRNMAEKLTNRAAIGRVIASCSKSVEFAFRNAKDKALAKQAAEFVVVNINKNVNIMLAKADFAKYVKSAKGIKAFCDILYENAVNLHNMAKILGNNNSLVKQAAIAITKGIIKSNRFMSKIGNLERLVGTNISKMQNVVDAISKNAQSLVLMADILGKSNRHVRTAAKTLAQAINGTSKYIINHLKDMVGTDVYKFSSAVGMLNTNAKSLLVSADILGKNNRHVQAAARTLTKGMIVTTRYLINNLQEMVGTSMTRFATAINALETNAGTLQITASILGTSRWTRGGRLVRSAARALADSVKITTQYLMDNLPKMVGADIGKLTMAAGALKTNADTLGVARKILGNSKVVREAATKLSEGVRATVNYLEGNFNKLVGNKAENMKEASKVISSCSDALIRSAGYGAEKDSVQKAAASILNLVEGKYSEAMNKFLNSKDITAGEILDIISGVDTALGALMRLTSSGVVTFEESSKAVTELVKGLVKAFGRLAGESAESLNKALQTGELVSQLALKFSQLSKLSQWDDLNLDAKRKLISTVQKAVSCMGAKPGVDVLAASRSEINKVANALARRGVEAMVAGEREAGVRDITDAISLRRGAKGFERFVLDTMASVLEKGGIVALEKFAEETSQDSGTHTLLATFINDITNNKDIFKAKKTDLLRDMLKKYPRETREKIQRLMETIGKNETDNQRLEKLMLEINHNLVMREIQAEGEAEAASLASEFMPPMVDKNTYKSRLRQARLKKWRHPIKYMFNEKWRKGKILNSNPKCNF